MDEPDRLAFKAHEIEELADRYFFRPLGMVAARAARSLRLTPTAVTLVGAVVGMAGGVLLSAPRLGLVAFGVLVLHSILDSADGQLARMTGRVSELGRILDGVSGYLTHAAIYVALVSAGVARGGRVSSVLLAIGAAFSNVVHAALYEIGRASCRERV